ncbi:MAG TPA: helix-turn-helix domain-containing protein [Burkholderiaceae bacterium]|nr:helix-turn-helix domain-containing protein [Burkholderiaceae bacterium]
MRGPGDTAATPQPVHVCFVLLPGSLLLDVAGPAEALRLADQQLERMGRAPTFRLRFLGAGACAASSVGLELSGLEPLPTTLPDGAWCVLVGQKGGEVPRHGAAWLTVRDWLGRTLDLTRHRLVTVCAGALLAADAGLLDGHRCTTHHELLDTLRARAPRTEVLANRVFVEDGPVASSAGITAGIDLMLHLIAQQAGDAVAAAVAQVMVVYLRRAPADPELSPYLSHRQHLHPAVHRVQDAVCADPARPWTVEEMARHARVTPRHLSRLFAEHAGVSPLHYLQQVRLARAQEALDQGATVTLAADRAGFGSDLALRRAWKAHRGGTPGRHRAARRA